MGEFFAHSSTKELLDLTNKPNWKLNQLGRILAESWANV